MKLHKLFSGLFLSVLFLSVVSCSKDETDETPDPNPTKDSLTFTEYTITGKIQTWTFSELIPWDKGACDMVSLVNGDKGNECAKGKINADGTFTLTFNKKLSKTHFMALSEGALLWGPGVSFSPSDAKAVFTLELFAIVNDGGTLTNMPIMGRVMGGNNLPVEDWAIVIFDKAGSIMGTDQTGNVWNYTFNQAWNIQRTSFDIPVKGTYTKVTAGSFAGNVVWTTF